MRQVPYANLERRSTSSGRTRSLGPEQHATREVKKFTSSRTSAASCLEPPSSFQGHYRVGARAVAPSSHAPAKCLALFGRELDVAHPQAYRGARDPEECGQLLDRAPLVAPKLAGLLPSVFTTDNR